MIFPLGVLGITSVKNTRSGTAILLIASATRSRIICFISARPVRPPSA